MGYFRVSETRNLLGQKRWRWNLHAVNGEVIATSEQYNSRPAAEHGARVVQKLATDAELRFV